MPFTLVAWPSSMRALANRQEKCTGLQNAEPAQIYQIADQRYYNVVLQAVTYRSDKQGQAAPYKAYAASQTANKVAAGF